MGKYTISASVEQGTEKDNQNITEDRGDQLTLYVPSLIQALVNQRDIPICDLVDKFHVRPVQHNMEMLYSMDRL